MFGRFDADPPGIEGDRLADHRDGGRVFGLGGVVEADEAGLPGGAPAHGEQPAEALPLEGGAVPDPAPQPGFVGQSPGRGREGVGGHVASGAVPEVARVVDRLGERGAAANRIPDLLQRFLRADEGDFRRLLSGIGGFEFGELVGPEDQPFDQGTDLPERLADIDDDPGGADRGPFPDGDGSGLPEGGSGRGIGPAQADVDLPPVPP